MTTLDEAPESDFPCRMIFFLPISISVFTQSQKGQSIRKFINHIVCFFGVASLQCIPCFSGGQLLIHVKVFCHCEFSVCLIREVNHWIDFENPFWFRIVTREIFGIEMKVQSFSIFFSNLFSFLVYSIDRVSRM